MQQDISDILGTDAAKEIFSFLERIEVRNAAIQQIIQELGRSYEDLRGEDEPIEAAEFNRHVDAAQEEGTELVLFLLKHLSQLAVELLREDMPWLHPDLTKDLQSVMENIPGPFDGERNDVLNEFAEALFAPVTESPEEPARA